MLVKIVLIAGVIIVTSAVAFKQKNMSYRQSFLKTAYPLIMKLSSSKGKEHTELNSKDVQPVTSIYEIPMTSIDGKPLDLKLYKGKKILIVNTASDCGFTGQYEALEKLYQQYKDKLVVIGVPANDFKKQESGTNENINAFCKKNYGVSFPLISKSIVIKTNDQMPLYQWLTNSNNNGWCNTAPEWNFCKYLIDEKGVLVGYFPMSIDPLSQEITKLLN
jgi:glutathione peroxidase